MNLKILSLFTLFQLCYFEHVKVEIAFLDASLAKSIDVNLYYYDPMDTEEIQVKDKTFLTCEFDRNNFCKQGVDMHVFELFAEDEKGIYPILQDKTSFALIRHFCKDAILNEINFENLKNHHKQYFNYYDGTIIKYYEFGRFYSCKIENDLDSEIADDEILVHKIILNMIDFDLVDTKLPIKINQAIIDGNEKHELAKEDTAIQVQDPVAKKDELVLKDTEPVFHADKLEPIVETDTGLHAEKVGSVLQSNDPVVNTQNVQSVDEALHPVADTQKVEPLLVGSISEKNALDEKLLKEKEGKDSALESESNNDNKEMIPSLESSFYVIILSLIIIY